MRRIQILITLVAITLIASMPGAAAAAPSADVSVRPQVGMAGIKLGDKATKVRRVLGVPTRVTRVQGGAWPYVKWRYAKLGVTVGLIGPRGKVPTVLLLSTDSTGAWTPRGVGVGSMYAEIASTYPQADCATYRGRRQCTLGEPGYRVTVFVFRGGLVRSIDIGDTF